MQEGLGMSEGYEWIKSVPDDHPGIPHENIALGDVVGEVSARESDESDSTLKPSEVQIPNSKQKGDLGIDSKEDGDKPLKPPAEYVWTCFGISFTRPETFSSRLRQLKFQKDPNEETDVVVFSRYKRKYYEAIDPWNRINVTNRYVVRVARYIESISGMKWTCEWISAFRRFCWYWLFGFLYRILNFWDLSLIHEVNVLSPPLDSTNSELDKRYQMAGREDHRRRVQGVRRRQGLQP